MKRVDSIKRFFYTAGLTVFLSVGLCEFIVRNYFLSFLFCLILATVSLFVVLLALFFGKKSKVIKYTAVICIFAALGQFVWAENELSNVKALSDSPDNRVNAVFQIVEENEHLNNGSVLYTAKVLSGDLPLNYKVCISDSLSQNFDICDIVSGSFRISNPGDFYYLSSRADGITFRVYIDRSADFSVSSPDKKPFFYIFHVIRTQINKTLDKFLGSEAAFAKGLMTGDKSSLSETQYDNLVNSGLLHITAVSGLHVGILSAILLKFLAFIKKKQLKYGLCFLVMFLLCGVCGFTPSVLRAVLMTSVIFFGELTGRRSDSINSFGLALLVLLLFDPFMVAKPSFLLSFSAVFSMITLYPFLESAVFSFLFRRFSYVGIPLARNLISIAIMSFCCSLYTAPICYLCFGNFTFLGVLSGIFIIPVVSFIFFLCLLVILMGQIGFLSSVCGGIALITKFGVDYIMYIAKLVSSISLSGYDFASSGLTAVDGIILGLVVLTALGAILVSVFFTVTKKRERMNKATGIITLFSSVLLIFTIIFSAVNIPRPFDYDGMMTVTFLNVGQGNCAVVTKDDFTAVIDCGGTRDPGKTAADYLRARNIDNIDYLFLSHLHSDHANGVKELCSRYDIDKIIMPETDGDPEIEEQVSSAAEEYGVSVSRITSDIEVRYSGTELNVYTGQLDADADDQNENSLIIVMNYLDFDVMFSGDITAAAEKRFVDGYGNIAVDVLGVPHHGSKYSSTEEFLTNTNASVFVISVDEANTYGHPDPDTVERLSEHGSVYMTKDRGDVEIRTDGDKIEIYSEK